MNRTIKFRGKDLFGTTWLYGDLVQDRDLRYIVTVNERDHFEHKMVDRETVGQFTGLHDSNGKEIYEGDIISGDQNTRHVVEYDADRSCFTCVLIGSDERKVKCIIGYKIAGISQDWINKYEKVVSGNIHDNPELKGGKQ